MGGTGPRTDGGDPRGRAGLRRRLFAWLVARSGPAVDRVLDERKRRLIPNLSGTVVEFGAGAGSNLPFVGRATRWIGIEPNPYLRRRIEGAAARLGREAEVVARLCEDTGLADRSADAVLCTHVLCSVADQDGALAEARRLLRPGGRLVFIEHVGAPPGTMLARTQRLLRRPWAWALDGCDPARDTLGSIERAGFGVVDLEHFRVPAWLVSPHVAGSAVPAPASG